MTFSAYIWCFYAQFSFDLVTFNFDPFDIGVSGELRAWYILHTYQFLASYDYPLLRICDNLITLPSHGTVTAHAPCHVTYQLGHKLSTFLKSLTPILLFTLSLYTGASTKIKPFCRRKIAFSYCEGYKVYCACALSRDLCIGGPPKPHLTIFWQFFDPKLSIHNTSFTGLRWRLRVVLYWSIPMLKRFSAAKESVQSKSVPKMAIFRKFKGLNIKYTYRDPKGTSLPGTTSSGAFCVKIRSRV